MSHTTCLLQAGSTMTSAQYLQTLDDDDDDDVNGVRLRLRTAITNGPIVHPPGDL
jgi:hypothetical protein